MNLRWYFSWTILIGTTSAQLPSIYVLSGQSAGELYGSALAGGGDFDLDGVPDFVIGAYGAPPPLRVEVRSGATGAVIRTLVPPSGLDATFGQALGVVSDLNGDGVHDIIVGQPGYSSGCSLCSNQGRVMAYSGASGGLLWQDPWPAWYSFHGTTFDEVGDMDNDGIADLAVGAPSTSGGAGFGNVRIISGASGSSIRDIPGTAQGAHFGSSVAGVGDLTGDGISEYAVSASETGQVVVLDGATDQELRRHTGGYRFRGQGCIAALADVDGDGVRDYAVGIDHFNGNTNSGWADVYSGQAGTQLWRFEWPVINSAFGAILSAPGDLNGDGVNDLVVSGKAVLRAFSLADGSTIGTVWNSSANFIVHTAVGDVDGDGLDELLYGVTDELGAGVVRLATLRNVVGYGFGGPVGADSIFFRWVGNSSTQPPTYGQIMIQGATPNSSGLLLLSTGAGSGYLAGNVPLVVDIGTSSLWIWLPLLFDGNGVTIFPSDLSNPAWVGTRLFAQVLGVIGRRQVTFESSNGMRFLF